MKKIISILFMTLVIFTLPLFFTNYLTIYASEGVAQWASSTVSGPNYSMFYKSVLDNDGNIYIAGFIGAKETYDFGNGVIVNNANGTGSGSTTRATIVKFNSNGVAQWAKSVVTAPHRSVFNTVAIDNQGNIYAGGTVTSTGTFDFGNNKTVTGRVSTNTAIIVKYNSSGDTQWIASPISASNSSSILGLSINNQNELIITGSITGTTQVNFGNNVFVTGTNASVSPLLMKYSLDGVAQWAKSTITSPSFAYHLYSVVDTDGNIYTTGFINGSGIYDFGNNVTVSGTYSSFNLLIVKFNSDGVAQWAKSTITGTNTSQFNNLVLGLNNDIYLAGYITGTGIFNFGNNVTVSGPNSGSNTVLARYDLNGNAIWAKSIINGPGSSSSLDVKIDRNGHVYTAGYINGVGLFNLGNNVTITGIYAGVTMILTQHDINGNPLWARSIVSGTNETRYTSLSLDSDDNVIGLGYIFGNQQFGFGNNVTATGSYSANTNLLLIKYSGYTRPYVFDPCSNGCFNGPDYSSLSAKSVTIIDGGDITSMVNFGTFKYDANLVIIETPKSGATKLTGIDYWQVGSKNEVWWKSADNDAKILSSEIIKPFTLIFKYNSSSLEKSIQEKTLKLAYSIDGKKWKIVPSILNIKRDEIATITKQGGFYTIVGGAETKHAAVAITTKTEEDQTPTATTSPEVNQENLTKSEVTPNKHCFLFFCW